jgi:ubiquinone/menaquinone biosynthesis C-methylase UbiE
VALPSLTPLAAAVLHVQPPPERALVLECGNGDSVFFLAREFPAARVRGIDSSEAWVREASARVGLDPEGRIAFKPGGPRTIPYPDAFFDLLVAVDASPAPAEALRVLRPSGYLVLAHSAPPSGALSIAARWQWRRLARRGVESLVVAEAGDGSFSVGRLAIEDRTAQPI